MGHARWLEQLLKKLPPETRDAPADFDRLEAARHMIKVPLAQSLATVETLEDAYQLAHELESSEINTIFDFLLSTFADDPQATQFARDQLSDHVARLSTGFPEPYTGAPSRARRFINSFASSSRPRLIRLLTVPSGTLRSSAIS